MSQSDSIEDVRLDARPKLDLSRVIFAHRAQEGMSSWLRTMCLILLISSVPKLQTNMRHVLALKTQLFEKFTPSAEDLRGHESARKWAFGAAREVIENPVVLGHTYLVAMNLYIHGAEACGDGATFAADGGYGVRLGGPFQTTIFPCEGVPKEQREPLFATYTIDNETIIFNGVNVGLPGWSASLDSTNRTDAFANLTALEKIARRGRPFDYFLLVLTYSPSLEVVEQVFMNIQRLEGSSQFRIFQSGSDTYSLAWPSTLYVVLGLIYFLAFLFVKDELQDWRLEWRHLKYVHGASASRITLLVGTVVTHFNLQTMGGWFNVVDAFLFFFFVVLVPLLWWTCPDVPPYPSFSTSPERGDRFVFDPLVSEPYSENTTLSVIYLSLCVAALAFRMLNEARWHRGVSAVINTLAYAGTPFANIVCGLFFLLFTFALGANAILGTVAGDENFATILDSLNAMGLLSFGLYEYGDLVNRGYGRMHDGIGMGHVGFFAPMLFWSFFFMLTILASNIFIAVVGDGYEDHVDRMEREVGGDGASFVVMLCRYLRSFTCNRSMRRGPCWAREFAVVKQPTLARLLRQLYAPHSLELFPLSVAKHVRRWAAAHGKSAALVRVYNSGGHAMATVAAESLDELREAIALLADAFSSKVADAEVEALWEVFAATDAPGFQPRAGEGEDGESAARTQGNIMRRTVDAVVRHNLERVEQRLSRIEALLAREAQE